MEFYTAGDYSTLAQAAYNGAGERVRLTTWAAGVPVTVTYAVFGGQLLMSSDGSRNTLYLYGRRLIAEYESEWAYPLRDRDGSARQIADRSGMVSLARTYKPLGGILQEQGAYESVFGYLGAQLDRISGLLYADGRYFDPTTGRFLTPNRRVDTYHPRSLNPYAPWVDPTMLLLAPLMVWATLAAEERRRRYGRWIWILLLLCVAVSVVGCGNDEDEDEATPITSLTATVILSSPLIVPHATETLIETPTRTMTLTVTPTSPATPTATILATLTCTPTPPTLTPENWTAVASRLYFEGASSFANFAQSQRVFEKQTWALRSLREAQRPNSSYTEMTADCRFLSACNDTNGAPAWALTVAEQILTDQPGKPDYPFSVPEGTVVHWISTQNFPVVDDQGNYVTFSSSEVPGCASVQCQLNDTRRATWLRGLSINTDSEETYYAFEDEQGQQLWYWIGVFFVEEKNWPTVYEAQPLPPPTEPLPSP